MKGMLLFFLLLAVVLALVALRYWGRDYFSPERRAERSHLRQLKKRRGEDEIDFQRWQGHERVADEIEEELRRDRPDR